MPAGHTATTAVEESGECAAALEILGIEADRPTPRPVYVAF
jgi:hypothetical protein